MLSTESTSIADLSVGLDGSSDILLSPEVSEAADVDEDEDDVDEDEELLLDWLLSDEEPLHVLSSAPSHCVVAPFQLGTSP